MKKITALLAGLLAASATPSLAATVIDFDNLGNGVQVTNQYAGVTFSSQAGSRVLTSAQNISNNSLPNFICSAKNNSSINCVDDVYVDFASAVNGLSFLVIGDNNVGDVGDVRVFGISGLLGTVNILTDGNFATSHLLDLSSFLDITRIEIANITDGGGLAYDDFTFAAAAAVPEASTWAMMLFGFGLVGAAARRRQRTCAIA
jgi:PEP-CTERM motif